MPWRVALSIAKVIMFLSNEFESSSWCYSTDSTVKDRLRGEVYINILQREYNWLDTGCINRDIVGYRAGTEDDDTACCIAISDSGIEGSGSAGILSTGAKLSPMAQWGVGACVCERERVIEREKESERKRERERERESAWGWIVRRSAV
jgi:hypothetical protein